MLAHASGSSHDDHGIVDRHPPPPLQMPGTGHEPGSPGEPQSSNPKAQVHELLYKCAHLLMFTFTQLTVVNADPCKRPSFRRGHCGDRIGTGPPRARTKVIDVDLGSSPASWGIKSPVFRDTGLDPRTSVKHPFFCEK